LTVPTVWVANELSVKGDESCGLLRFHLMGREAHSPLSSDQIHYPLDSRGSFRFESIAMDKIFVQIVQMDCIREDLSGSLVLQQAWG
jgi:hypothetical protein